jgi:hypothetical protein
MTNSLDRLPDVTVDLGPLRYLEFHGPDYCVTILPAASDDEPPALLTAQGPCGNGRLLLWQTTT